MPEALAVEYLPIEQKIPYVRNAHTHSEARKSPAACVSSAGLTRYSLTARAPSLPGMGGCSLPGSSARRLSQSSSRLRISPKRSAYVLADNKLAEKAGWNKDLLSLELAKGTSLHTTPGGWCAAESRLRSMT